MTVRSRFFIEAGSAILFASLTVATLLWPAWIELVFGVNPDMGSGALEVGLTLVTGACTIASLILSWLEWHRYRRPVAEARRG